MEEGLVCGRCELRRLSEARPGLNSQTPAAATPEAAGAGKSLRLHQGGGMGDTVRRNANPYDFSNDAGQVLDEATADKLEAHPELLAIPLENIARWTAAGTHSAHSIGRLEQWREWILEAQRDPEAFRHLMRLLRDDSEEARHWKSWSPFAGVLDAEKRDEILRECMSEV